MTPRPILAFALLLSGCGFFAEPEGRYLIEPQASSGKVRVAAGSIEVRDVSLPAYAAEADILAESPDGALYSQESSLWADDPVRGVTSALVRVLSDGTTATVAAEPWPLTEPADVRLDVRVGQMYARANGIFEMTGQFAVASPDEITGEFVRTFEIRVPMAGEGSGAVARAQSAAIGELGRLVATSLR